jgi:hypothetical protein
LPAFSEAAGNNIQTCFRRLLIHFSISQWTIHPPIGLVLRACARIRATEGELRGCALARGFAGARQASAAVFTDPAAA